VRLREILKLDVDSKLISYNLGFYEDCFDKEGKRIVEN